MPNFVDKINILKPNNIDMKLLEGKVALITGAARGIGKAIALKYAEQGANIAFTDLVIDENGENTKKESSLTGTLLLLCTYSFLNLCTTEIISSEILRFASVSF